MSCVRDINSTIQSIATNSSVYDHPLSKILSKADGILLGGMKYSAYGMEVANRQRNQSTNNVQSTAKEICFPNMLKKHQEKRKNWSKRIDDKRKRMEESLKMLDTLKLDEVEQVIPIRTEPQK